MMLGFIKMTITSRNPTISTRLYKYLVRPHLEYSTVAWSSHYKKDRELIGKVQQRIMRLITPLRQLEYDVRFKRLGLWTL